MDMKVPTEIKDIAKSQEGPTFVLGADGHLKLIQKDPNIAKIQAQIAAMKQKMVRHMRQRASKGNPYRFEQMRNWVDALSAMSIIVFDNQAMRAKMGYEVAGNTGHVFIEKGMAEQMLTLAGGMESPAKPADGQMADAKLAFSLHNLQAAARTATTSPDSLPTKPDGSPGMLPSIGSPVTVAPIETLISEFHKLGGRDEVMQMLRALGLHATGEIERKKEEWRNSLGTIAPVLTATTTNNAVAAPTVAEEQRKRRLMSPFDMEMKPA